MTLIPESLAKTSNVEEGEDAATTPLRRVGPGVRAVWAWRRPSAQCQKPSETSPNVAKPKFLDRPPHQQFFLGCYKSCPIFWLVYRIVSPASKRFMKVRKSRNDWDDVFFITRHGWWMQWFMALDFPTMAGSDHCYIAGHIWSNDALTWVYKYMVTICVAIYC